MIQNMKLGVNNLCVLSVNAVWSLTTLLFGRSSLYFVNLNSDHNTAFCTILEYFDGKGCGHGMYAHLMTTPLAVPTSKATKIAQNAVRSKL